MIEIDMKLKIEINNYADVVTKQRGAGLLTSVLNLPVVNIFTNMHVDQKVEDRINSSLLETLPSSIEESLAKNGINANVSVEFE